MRRPTEFPALILRRRHGRYDAAVVFTALNEYDRVHLVGDPVELADVGSLPPLLDMARAAWPEHFPPPDPPAEEQVVPALPPPDAGSQVRPSPFFERAARTR